MMPDRFTPVERAASEWSLTTESRLLKYPDSTTWRLCRGEHRVLNELDRALKYSGAVGLTGQPKTGKTFHSLLLGHHWMEQSKAKPGLFGMLKSTVEPRAFYGKAKHLQLARVLEQWKTLKDAACGLWIVDDVQNDIAKCEHLLAHFEDEDLEQQGHRLLLVGWSIPESLLDAPPTVLGLTGSSIRSALKLSLDYDLESPSAEALANSGDLLTILEEARWNPSALSDPSAILRRSLQRRLDPLNGPQRSLVVELARLSFLGVPLPADSQGRTLQELVDQGLAQESLLPPRSFELVSDQLGRAVFRVELQPFEFQASLLSPLNAIMIRLPLTAWPIVSALRRRTMADLRDWTGAALSGEDSKSLLSVFLGYHQSSVIQAALEPSVELVDAVRLLVTCKNQTSVESTAKDLLRQRQIQVLDVLASGDPIEWRAISTLCRMASESGLKRELLSVVQGPRFTDALRSLSDRERGDVLAEVARLDDAVSRGIKRSLLPENASSFGGELSALGPRTAWKALTRASQIDPEFAVDAFARLGASYIQRASMSTPRRLMSFLACIRDENHRKLFLGRLKTALAGLRLTHNHVEQWTSGYEVIQFIALARRIARPDLVDGEAFLGAAQAVLRDGGAALVVNLCRSLAKWKDCPTQLPARLAGTLAQRIGSSSDVENEHVFGLVLLDRHGARDHVELALQAWLDSSEERNARGTFWLLLNAATALDEARRSSLLRVANVASDGVRPIVGTPIERIVLNGLGSFLTEKPASAIATVGSTEAFRACTQSPVLAACALYAVVQQDDRDRGWLEVVRMLVESIAEPDAGYRKNWHNLPPRTRRIVLRIVERAWTKLLRSDPASPCHAIVTGFSMALIASNNDDIWDDYILIRLRLSILVGGAESAWALLSRRIEPWLKKISDGHIRREGLIRFLLCASAVAATQHGGREAAERLVCAGSAAEDTDRGWVPRVVATLQRLLKKGMPLSAERIPPATGPLDCNDPLVRLLETAARGESAPAGLEMAIRGQLTSVEIAYLEAAHLLRTEN